MIRLAESGRDLRAAIGCDTGDEALNERLFLRAAERHGPLDGVVEDEDADQIDGPEVIDDAERGQARQFDFLALHGGRLVDDEYDGGAFGSARRRHFGGHGAVERVFDLLVLGVDIVLAADDQQTAALLDETLDLVLALGWNGLEVPVVQDDDLII